MPKGKMQSKRTQGRPPRGDDPTRLVVRVSAELKRWLAHRSIDEDRDMGSIVTEALESYRKRVGSKP